MAATQVVGHSTSQRVRGRLDTEARTKYYPEMMGGLVKVVACVRVKIERCDNVISIACHGRKQKCGQREFPPPVALGDRVIQSICPARYSL